MLKRILTQVGTSMEVSISRVMYTYTIHAPDISTKFCINRTKDEVIIIYRCLMA